MQKLIECELNIVSVIDNKREETVLKGKGFYKDNEEKSVYFKDGEIAYKYIIKNDKEVMVHSNNSLYLFVLGKKKKSIINSEGYSIEIEVYTKKIIIQDNLIYIEYNISQNNNLLGSYEASLTF